MPVSLVLANCFRTKFWETVYPLIEGEIERISNTPCSRRCREEHIDKEYSHKKIKAHKPEMERKEDD